jgi:hypothetical protein
LRLGRETQALLCLASGQYVSRNARSMSSPATQAPRAVAWTSASAASRRACMCHVSNTISPSCPSVRPTGSSAGTLVGSVVEVETIDVDRLAQPFVRGFDQVGGVGRPVKVCGVTQDGEVAVGAEDRFDVGRDGDRDALQGRVVAAAATGVHASEAPTGRTPTLRLNGQRRPLGACWYRSRLVGLEGAQGPS